jgi:hypothetical protein
MSKRMIVEVNLLSKLFGAFFKAKEAGKEDAFKDALRSKDAELGKVWDSWDASMEKTLLATRRALQNQKKDSKVIDDLLAKYY